MNSDQVTLVGQVFESYVLEYHKNDMLLILKERDEDAHYPVVVNAMTLFETNMEIGEYFNAFPNEVLTIFDNALRRSALTILQSLSQPEGLSMKQNLHARISAQSVKNLPAVQETRVRSLGWEDPLEKEMATHSSILAWTISWTEEPGGLQSMGSQRVGHD
uniref:Minichromosome maintenance 9 homologous recombination repair factor n=1 Tax=Ovis aries TaxID=9940 RepID=A0AC11ENZ2_SHEEP